ncbi:hypothetical protein Tcan_18582 [Toxocara canis]|uniref:SEA domain-containing protein n=1 Tax=Toxocara canis TaxID=6265 RepID=A0A0B2VHI6_TOXCA|nr:hypothetical protein Tcan_18582 [Toxocara canis]
MSFGSAGRFQRRSDSEFVDQRRGSVYSTDASDRGYEPGTGAEFMARSGWGRNNSGPYTRNAFTTDEHPITFHKKSTTKTALIVTLIVIGVLLTLLIVAIIVLLALRVFVLNPQDDNHSTLHTPTYRPPFTLPPTVSIFPPITHTFPQTISSSSSTLPPLPPITLPPTALPIPLTSSPPVEQFVKRNFVGNLYILQQANPAYDDKSHFEYTQATQMILNALKSMLDQSTLASYLTGVSIASLQNSGSNVLVEFNVDLFVPSQSGIDASVVRNVILSDLSRMEQQLNDVQIERDNLFVFQA